MSFSVAMMKQLRVSAVLALLLAVSGFGLTTCADPIAEHRDRSIAVTVATLLPRIICRGIRWTTRSRRHAEDLLKNLDPMKVYFYQSDVDAFAQKQNELDDMVKRETSPSATRCFGRS